MIMIMLFENDLIMIAYTGVQICKEKSIKFHIHCFINQDIYSFIGSESKEYANCYIIWIICCIWIWLNFSLFIIKLWSWINSHWVSWQLSREKKFCYSINRDLDNFQITWLVFEYIVYMNMLLLNMSSSYILLDFIYKI